jgi:hypothetical protein
MGCALAGLQEEATYAWVAFSLRRHAHTAVSHIAVLRMLWATNSEATPMLHFGFCGVGRPVAVVWGLQCSAARWQHLSRKVVTKHAYLLVFVHVIWTLHRK